MQFNVFQTIDEQYLAWMHQHPEGFVLNTTRHNSGYAMLHRSGCHHIAVHNSNYADDAFTGHQYIKVCADYASTLHTWARANRQSATFRICSSCKPKLDLAESIDDMQIASDLEEIARRPGLAPTVREALVQARLGHGKFRKQMLELWGGKCAVTGLTIQSALIASHAKPWADSNDEERLDPCNGLPLIATLDRLFDRFLIAFDPRNGTMQVSPEIDDASRAILRIPADLRLIPNAQQALYLQLHFDTFNSNHRSASSIP